MSEYRRYREAAGSGTKTWLVVVAVVLVLGGTLGTVYLLRKSGVEVPGLPPDSSAMTHKELVQVLQSKNVRVELFVGGSDLEAGVSVTVLTRPEGSTRGGVYRFGGVTAIKHPSESAAREHAGTQPDGFAWGRFSFLPELGGPSGPLLGPSYISVQAFEGFRLAFDIKRVLNVPRTENDQKIEARIAEAEDADRKRVADQKRLDDLNSEAFELTRRADRLIERNEDKVSEEAKRLLAKVARLEEQAEEIRKRHGWWDRFGPNPSEKVQKLGEQPRFDLNLP